MLSIRRATLGDVDILVDLTQSSMDGTSQCDYRFPHARQYPDENAMYFRIRYTSMMTATDQNWTVYIASLSQGEEDQEKPIAFAFWRMDNLAEPAGSEVVIPRPEVQQILSEDEDREDPPPGRDGDVRRIREYNRAIEEARRRYFTGPYGTAYIELLILGTDPGYRGLGAGTALCNWGIEKAREARKKTALFAMPSSITFYSSQLGFHEVGEPIIIQVDGDPEKLEIVAMVLDWKKPSPKLDRVRSGE